MFRYFVILSFLVGTPGLFADDLPGACTKTWKFTSSAVTASKYDQALITADLNTLQSMLDCVNNASLRLPPDVAAKGVDAKYKAVISDATETNKDAALFKDFVTKLKKTGAQVEFQVEPGKGHERPGADIIDIYMKWVESVMN